MARLSTINLAVLNIVTQPHSPKIYADLFLDAFKRHRKPFKLRGDYYGLVQSCFLIDSEDPGVGFEGDLIRFLQIKTDEPWFNLDRVEVASDAEMKAIHIPDHLRPHTQQLRYVFDPQQHRLVYVERKPKATLSPPLAQRLMEQFLNLPDGPNVTVTVEQSREGLDKVFKMATLRELEIVIDRPNADDFSAFEKALTTSLEKQHVGKMRLELVADQGSSLKPDEEKRKLAKVAVSNGMVIGRGTDEEGKKVEVSTSDHPFLATFKARLDQVNLGTWLKEKAQDVIAAVRDALHK